jgi:hypothetical protein
MNSIHHLQVDDAGQLWLHLEAPSGSKASICLSGLARIGIVHQAIDEIAKLATNPDAAAIYEIATAKGEHR